MKAIYLNDSATTIRKVVSIIYKKKKKKKEIEILVISHNNFLCL